jgi:hypothetical protein
VDGLRAHGALSAGMPRHLVAAGIASDPRTFAKAWRGNDPAPVVRELARYGVTFSPPVFTDSNLLHSGPSIARHRLLKSRGSRADQAARREFEREQRAERAREREREQRERQALAGAQRRGVLAKAQRAEQAQRRELARRYRAMTTGGADLHLFTCPNRQGNLRLTPTAFASSWRRHRADKGHQCQGCPVGAEHAGEPAPAPPPPAPAPGACALCGRRRREIGRLIFNALCPSCYNRLAEAAKGQNARGHPPQFTAHLRVFQNVIEVATDAQNPDSDGPEPADGRPAGDACRCRASGPRRGDP